eukprot:PhM_4_TR15662/c2_g1_i1/m.3374
MPLTWNLSINSHDAMMEMSNTSPLSSTNTVISHSTSDPTKVLMLVQQQQLQQDEVEHEQPPSLSMCVWEWKCNEEDQIWRRRSQPLGFGPILRRDCTFTATDSYHVVYGGRGVDRQTCTNFNDVWIFREDDDDDDHHGWRLCLETGSETVCCPRYGHTCTWVGDDTCLVFGGARSDSSASPDIFGALHINPDDATVTYKSLKSTLAQPDASPLRHHHAAAYLRCTQTLYLLGGVSPNDPTRFVGAASPKHIISSYCVATSTWRRVVTPDSVLLPRCRLSVSAGLGDRFYVLGGILGSCSSTSSSYSACTNTAQSCEDRCVLEVAADVNNNDNASSSLSLRYLRADPLASDQCPEAVFAGIAVVCSSKNRVLVVEQAPNLTAVLELPRPLTLLEECTQHLYMCLGVAATRRLVSESLPVHVEEHVLGVLNEWSRTDVVDDDDDDDKKKKKPKSVKKELSVIGSEINNNNNTWEATVSAEQQRAREISGVKKYLASRLGELDDEEWNVALDQGKAKKKGRLQRREERAEAARQQGNYFQQIAQVKWAASRRRDGHHQPQQNMNVRKKQRKIARMKQQTNGFGLNNSTLSSSKQKVHRH